MELRRRDLLRTSLVAAGGLALGPAFWRDRAFASAATTPGPGPYGPLMAADANGLRLPAGFRSRVVARGLVPTGPRLYPWHLFSDGMAAFETGDGGWILVSNSEIDANAGGGASALRFDGAGRLVDAYRILGDTSTNCSGGPTPWGTWLSGEEHERGRVWECDPTGERPAVPHAALGVFKHEAVCVDPVHEQLFLTEDLGDGLLYRFTPTAYPALDDGVLEAAVVDEHGQVTWARVPDPLASTTPTREQVPGATVFRRGEGIFYDSGIVYVATTSDERIHAYNTFTETIEVLYDGEALGDAAPLHGVDNVTVAKRSGDVFVAEDGDDMGICLITAEREVAAFAQATGPEHLQGLPEVRSEVTGVTFDPSGTRLYFSSQRAFGVGVIYEISGPFRDRPRDLVAPALRVDVAERITGSRLRRRGLRVGLRNDERARIRVTLRTTGRRPRTLSRASLDVGAGARTVTLRLGHAGREAIRGRRRVRATLTVVATDTAGNRRTAQRPVEIHR